MIEKAEFSVFYLKILLIFKIYVLLISTHSAGKSEPCTDKYPVTALSPF